MIQILTRVEPHELELSVKVILSHISGGGFLVAYNLLT